MDDIIRWLDTLEPGSEILTPDDWALGKRADGTWEFVFAPCMTVTAGQVAAHGRPEIIPPHVWDLRGECAVVDGVIACSDPLKRIEYRAGDDPHGFLRGDTPDPNVSMPEFHHPPVCSGLEYGVEWAVYGDPPPGAPVARLRAGGHRRRDRDRRHRVRARRQRLGRIPHARRPARGPRGGEHPPDAGHENRRG